jgi:hypothetical protein
VHELWELTDRLPGRFRSSAFEYRPWPGTPGWHRLLATGRYTPAQLLNYTAVDLADRGVDESMRERHEFNFSGGDRYRHETLNKDLTLDVA